MAVASHIPRHAHTRGKILPLVVHALIGRKPGITRKQDARWCRGKPFALDALSQRINVEVEDRVIEVDHREEWFPAQAIIQGHLSVQLPSIGSVQAKVLGPLILIARSAIPKCVHSPDKKI